MYDRYRQRGRGAKAKRWKVHQMRGSPIPMTATGRPSWPFRAAAGYTALVTVWVLGHWTNDRALLDRIIPWETLPAQVLVIIALGQFLRDCPPLGARGRAWNLLLVGFGLNLAGSVIWVTETAAGVFAYGLNDLFFGACVPLFALAAAMLFVDLGGSFRRPRVWLDAMTLMLALGAMLWEFSVGPALLAGVPRGLRVVVTLGYGVGASAMLVFSALAYMRITDWRRERALVLLFAGAIVSFGADLLWADIGARGTPAAASVYQIAYCVGDLLLIAAIVAERRRPADRGAERPDVSPASAVPAFAVLVAIGVIVTAHAHEGPLRSTLPMVLAVLGAALVAVREIGARHELHALARAAARKDADKRLTELVRRSGDVIVVADYGGRLTYVSPPAERVLGTRPEQLIGREVAVLLGESNRPRVGELVSGLARGSREQIEIEVDFEHPALHHRVLQVLGSDEGSTSLIGGIALTIRDVTEQRNAERELHEAASRRHAALSYDIHEGLAQELAGISLLIRSLGRTGRESADEQELLDTLPTQLSQAVDNARRLAATLSPLHSADGSFELAMRSLAERIEQAGQLKFGLRCELGGGELPSALSEELYRIVVEAVECAAMDADSSRIDVELRTTGEALQIQMGWDAGPRATAGELRADALRIIGHRARRLRGLLTLEDSSDGGVRLLLNIPLDAVR